jgi:hypothetical protein
MLYMIIPQVFNLFFYILEDNKNFKKLLQV